MMRFLPAGVLPLLLLAACAQQPVPSASAPAAETTAELPPQQLDFTLASGRYRCEYGITVQVERDRSDPRVLLLGWHRGKYRLVREASGSGLPRYEDAAAGLVWIDLPWKSVLLDGHSGKPLASECRHA